MSRSLDYDAFGSFPTFLGPGFPTLDQVAAKAEFGAGGGDALAASAVSEEKAKGAPTFGSISNDMFAHIIASTTASTTCGAPAGGPGTTHHHAVGGTPAMKKQLVQAAAGASEAKGLMAAVAADTTIDEQLSTLELYYARTKAGHLSEQTKCEGALRDFGRLPSPANAIVDPSTASATKKGAASVLAAIAGYAVHTVKLGYVQCDVDVVSSMRQVVQAQRSAVRAGISLADATAQAAHVLELVVQATSMVTARGGDMPLAAAGAGAGSSEAAPPPLSDAVSMAEGVTLAAETFRADNAAKEGSGSASELAASLIAAAESALAAAASPSGRTERRRELAADARSRVEAAAQALWDARAAARARVQAQKEAEQAHTAVCAEASELREKKTEGGLPLARWAELATALSTFGGAGGIDAATLSSFPLADIEAYGRAVAQRLAPTPKDSGVASEA